MDDAIDRPRRTLSRDARRLQLIEENLLAETLGFLAEEYQRNWQSALAAAGPEAADRLIALIEADLQPTIMTPDRLAAWCAFWGESQSRPVYQRICGARDAFYVAQLEGICSALIADAGYALDPVHAARILRLVLEGIWVDMISLDGTYPLTEARQTVTVALALCFGRHFAPDGSRLARPQATGG
jgi:TetR/AcrR family transcriptional regulator, transcriptional repressor of bet genes